MGFQTEIEKLARTRRAYLRFALSENTGGRTWSGAVDQRYGKVGDAQATVPVVGTVSRFGTIQRSLANYLYSLEIPSVSIELFDPDRAWRRRAGGFEDELIYRNLSLWLRVLDDALVPYDERVTVAQIIKPTFPQGRVTFDCKVAAGEFLGAKVPRRFITTSDFPNAPTEVQGLAVPIIYGRRYNEVKSVDVAPPTYLPGTGAGDDPATLPPMVPGVVVYCNDLWNDDFEGETSRLNPVGLAAYTTTPDPTIDAPHFALVGGEGEATYVDFPGVPSQAVRPLSTSAELVKILTPPRRGFCVTWSSDHDQPRWSTAQYMVEGVNVYCIGEDAISIEVPLAGRLKLLQTTDLDPILVPEQRQRFKLEGAFATKNLSVTLTQDFEPEQGTLYVHALNDIPHLRIGMHLEVGGEVVRVLSFETSGGNPTGGVRVVRALYDTYPGGGARFIPGEGWVYYSEITPSGTVLPTYDQNGYIKFWIDDVVKYTLLNTDVVRSASDTGAWTRVAWSMNGDGDELHIGSGIAYPSLPGTGTALPPATPVDCDPGGTQAASGGATRAILVGTYMRGDTGDVLVQANPCGRSPYGSVAAVAADLQAHKNAGTLMSSHFPSCIGYNDCQKIKDLGDDPVPTTAAELGALIGPADLNCLAFGQCEGTAGGTGSQDNMYVLAGHALHKVEAVYVLKPVVLRIEGDEPVWSEPLQVKQVEGTDYRQQIREVNGHRYHLLLFQTAQISETCEYFEVTANVEGIETNGDGTGTLLTNADDIFAHMMLNWIFNNYQSSIGPYAPPSGPWFTDVAYAPGIWNQASVEAAKAVADARVPGGYVGSGTLDEVIEAREWIRELLISFDLELYFDNATSTQGAWCIRRFDATALRASLPHWSAGADAILKDSFSLDIPVDQMMNVLPFFGGPTTQRMDTAAPQGATNARGGGWRISGEMTSTASVSRFGMAIAEPFYLKWTDHAATVTDVMARYLKYQELPPVIATFRIGLRALTSPLGSLIRLTHPDGLGATGWTEHVCKVTRSDLDMDRLIANVTVVSVDRLMGA